MPARCIELDSQSDSRDVPRLSLITRNLIIRRRRRRRRRRHRKTSRPSGEESKRDDKVEGGTKSQFPREIRPARGRNRNGDPDVPPWTELMDSWWSVTRPPDILVRSD
jgi:hypothetical protein